LISIVIEDSQSRWTARRMRRGRYHGSRPMSTTRRFYVNHLKYPCRKFRSIWRVWKRRR